jgi:hypothetical protein
VDNGNRLSKGKTVRVGKPDFVFDMIERQFPNVPKIELSRRGGSTSWLGSLGQ